MLLRQAEDGVLVIGQASHAWISGQLARAWGNTRFPAPAPREEVCLAADQHDVGWTDWDLHPSLDTQTGLPHPFLEMPDLATHIALWSAAPDRLRTQSAYASLLVSMHGNALYARRNLEEMPARDADLVRRYLAAEQARQAELRSILMPNERELQRNQRLIWTWDSLSLALCLPWDPHTATRVPTADGEIDLQMRSTGENRFELNPWPFTASEVDVHCEARRLSRRFQAESDLHGALRAAPVERLAFTLSK